MAKKKKKAQKPQRAHTRHQLASWQREKRRQRIIFSAGIFIIAAALMIVVVGWYASQYRPLHQTVIRVNDTEFDMKYYIEMLKLNGQGQPPEYVQLTADSIIEQIEQNELIRQEALKLGISVSKEEVKEKLESSDIPANDITRNAARNQILIDKLLDEYFDPQIPVSAEQRHVMAMLLESESQAQEVKSRLASSDNFTSLAEELSLDFFTKSSKGDLGWHTQNVFNESLGSSIPVDYAFSAGLGVISPPIHDEEIRKNVAYWLINITDRKGEEDETEAQVMLLGSEQEAQEVRTRLEAGEDFATLAKELSQLPGVEENGGELSVSPDMMTPAFDEFAFDTDVAIGTLSEPIRDETLATKGGYWLIKVLDKDENRPIEDEDRDLLKAKAFDEWVTSLLDDPNNMVDDSFLDDERKSWAVEWAIKELQLSQGN